MSEVAPRLRIVGLEKRFGGTHALRGVDLHIARGEIHGLVGENGAGKSTLIRCVGGVIAPDGGSIELEGETIRVRSPREAMDRGIAVVHQEAACFGELSVAENMLLPDRLVRWGRLGPVRWPSSHGRARRELAALGIDLDVRQRAGRLSVAERMLMQTAANVAHDVRVLFLDEPSASLTGGESELLFAQVRRLSERGVSVVFVSHRLAEVRRLCHRVTVLRDGARVWTRDVEDATVEEMVSALVGREVALTQRHASREFGAPLLQVRALSDAGGRFADVDVTVRAGEVVGLYGLVGAGRSELAQALFGLRPIASGQIMLCESRYTPSTPTRALRSGLAYVPEDRLGQGIFPSLSVSLNATISMMASWSRALLRRCSRERAHVASMIEELRVKLADARQPVQTLSGGNQQKILLGRSLSTGARVMLLDEPTRGVDVHAKAEIHEAIDRLAARGDGVVVISSDLPEVLSVSDRVAVMREGRLVATVDGRSATEEQIVSLSLPQEEHAHASKPRRTRTWLRDTGLVAAMLLIAVMMSARRPEAFATWQNAVDVASSVSIVAILTVGATLVIGVGGIDISAGSVMGLVGAVAALAAQEAGWPAWAALTLALALGAAIGVCNALFCMIGGIHPIVVTLAGLAVYRGVMLAVTGGYEIGEMPAAYLAIGNGMLGPLPKVVWFALGVIVCGWLFLSHWPVGRRLLAVGGSRRAAEQIGIARGRLFALAFAINGALVGLAGVLHGTYYTKIQSNTGEGIELQAIAAAVIGGCSIAGGTGSAIGAALGALLIGLVYNALILWPISSYWHPFFVGLLILAAAALDGSLRRR